MRLWDLPLRAAFMGKRGGAVSDIPFSRADCARASAGMKAELERRVIGRPHRRVLWFLRSRSFDCGYRAAYVKTQRGFMADTGLDEGDLSRGLKELIEAKVVLTGPKGCYWINIRFAEWELPKLWDIEGWEEHHRPGELPFDPAELPDGLEHLMRHFFLASEREDLNKMNLPSAHWAAVPGAESRIEPSDHGVSAPRVTTETGKHGGESLATVVGAMDRPAGASGGATLGSTSPQASILQEREDCSLTNEKQAGTQRVPAAYEPTRTPDAGASVGDLEKTWDNPKFSKNLSTPQVLGTFPSTPDAATAPVLGTFPSTLETTNVSKGETVLGKVPSTPADCAKSAAASLARRSTRKEVHEETEYSAEYTIRGPVLGGAREVHGLAKGVKRNWEREHAMVSVIGDFLGPLVMNGDGTKKNRGEGGWWRAYVVRNVSDEVIETACSEGRYMALMKKPFNKNRAAWLSAYVAELAGLKSLKGLPPGPRPVS